MNPKIRQHQRKHEAQEGMVLVVVLMIILLTTATATFALQGSAVEVQAAGSTKRSMVVRSVAESMVMAGASLIDVITVHGTTTPGLAAPDLDYAGIGPLGPNVAGLPQVLFDNASLTRAVLTEAQQRDDVEAVASGNPTSDTVPNYQIISEVWDRTDPSAGTVGDQSRIVWLAIASSAPGVDVTTPGETRSWHQLVSITQAYFDTN